MNPIAISIVLILVAIAFVATIISGVIKLIFFFHQKGTYPQILKFGLLGELLGLVFMLIGLAMLGQETKDLTEPVSVIALPFYSMLAGQLVGLIVLLRRTKS